jgi:hypothetical protein
MIHVITSLASDPCRWFLLYCFCLIQSPSFIASTDHYRVPVIIGRMRAFFGGGRGFIKVSLVSAMHHPSGGQPLRWPYGCFRGGHLQGRRSAAVFCPLGHSMICIIIRMNASPLWPQIDVNGFCSITFASYSRPRSLPIIIECQLL